MIGAMLQTTGERYDLSQTGRIRYEHWHRYRLAARFVEGKDVLDIACGEGYGSDLLAELSRSTVGVDLAEEAVSHASRTYRRENLRFLVGSTDAVPLPDASVDVVVSFETIEHHDRHERMLQEIRRVLRPGGIGLISSPDRAVYSELMGYRNPYHVKELDRKELEALLLGSFPYVRLFAQRAAFVSAVFDPDNNAVPATWMTETGENPLAAEYLLAFCSDRPLPPLTQVESLFAERADEPMRELEGAFARLQDEAVRGRDESVRLQEELDKVKAALNTSQVDFAEASAEIVRLQEYIASLKAHAESLQLHADGLQEHVARVEAHGENLAARSSEQSVRLEALEAERNLLARRIDEALRRIGDLEPKASELDRMKNSPLWPAANRLMRATQRREPS